MAQAFVFKPNEAEAKNFELFFQRFGGFSAFVRKAAQTSGYKPLPSLAEVAKRCAKTDDAVSKEWEETLTDGE